MKTKWKKKGHYIDVKFENPYNNYNLRKIIYHQYLSIFVGFFALMGAQLDRLRYEVFQNLFYSPMNTGILRAAVATAPTVYGIETLRFSPADEQGNRCNSTYRLRYWNFNRFLSNSHFIQLQQHLPFTVLKRIQFVLGVEIKRKLQQHLPFTVLKLKCSEILYLLYL